MHSYKNDKSTQGQMKKTKTNTLYLIVPMLSER